MKAQSTANVEDYILETICTSFKLSILAFLFVFLFASSFVVKHSLAQ